MVSRKSTVADLKFISNITPRRFVTFGYRPDGANQFITGTIFSRGLWQNVGTAPMQMGINLLYAMEGRQLRLGINEARLQLPEWERMFPRDCF